MNRFISGIFSAANWLFHSVGSSVGNHPTNVVLAAETAWKPIEPAVVSRKRGRPIPIVRPKPVKFQKPAKNQNPRRPVIIQQPSRR